MTGLEHVLEAENLLDWVDLVEKDSAGEWDDPEAMMRQGIATAQVHVILALVAALTCLSDRTGSPREWAGAAA